MAAFGYNKKDAAACLTAAVLCAIEKGQDIFLCYVGRLLSERSGQSPTETLKTLFDISRLRCRLSMTSTA